MAGSSPDDSNLQLSSGSYLLLPLIPRCSLGLVCEGDGDASFGAEHLLVLGSHA